MELTQERIEEVINEVHSWSDEKVEHLTKRLFDLGTHAIKTNTPNLINETDAKDMLILIDAFRVDLQQQKEVVFIETGIIPTETNVTEEDKDALLEFADKLKNKTEQMPVTATIDPVTQEEAPTDQPLSPSTSVSGTTLESTNKDPQATLSTSKKANGKNSLKPKKEDK